jgi:hypothetical protein
MLFTLRCPILLKLVLLALLCLPMIGVGQPIITRGAAPNETDSGTLVAILRLRSFGSRTITTVHGRGHRFCRQSQSQVEVPA